MNPTIHAMAVTAALSLVGCTAPAPMQNVGMIYPPQAVQMAAATAPDGVAGVFDIEVKSTGTKDGFVYLNSEADYRDQRNVSIAITPRAVRAMQSTSGANLLDELNGKHVLVRGQARRVTVFFYADGHKTDKYYYQTHVTVRDGRQLLFLN